MDSFKSLLNPYAAPFVPISRRAVAVKDENIEKLSCVVDQGKSPDSCCINVPCTGEVHVSEEVSSNIPTGPFAEKVPVLDFGTSSLEPVTQDMLEKFCMISEILCNEFPDLSKESIAEVFYANACDVEETINMLEDMEDLTTEIGFIAKNPNTSGTVDENNDSS